MSDAVGRVFTSEGGLKYKVVFARYVDGRWRHVDLRLAEHEPQVPDRARCSEAVTRRRSSVELAGAGGGGSGGGGAGSQSVVLGGVARGRGGPPDVSPTSDARRRSRGGGAEGGTRRRSGLLAVDRGPDAVAAVRRAGALLNYDSSVDVDATGAARRAVLPQLYGRQRRARRSGDMGAPSLDGTASAATALRAAGGTWGDDAGAAEVEEEEPIMDAAALPAAAPAAETDDACVDDAWGSAASEGIVNVRARGRARARGCVETARCRKAEPPPPRSWQL